MELTDMPRDVREVVTGYILHIHDKIAFLETLYDQGRGDEALTLCCVYIEGLAQRIYGKGSKGGSKRLFVKVLLEHGGEESLRLVDPPTLVKSLRGVTTSCGGPNLLGLAESIEVHYCTLNPTELRTIDDLLDGARKDLPAELLPLLGEHVWRGTIAALVYRELRSPLAHGRPGAPAGLFFGNTVFRGKQVERVSFDTIYAALWRIGKFWKEQLVTDVPLPDQDHE